MEAWVETLHLLNNQKEDNNQSKINKQPEVPENQTAWNSNNQGIKEKGHQNNQTSKVAEGVGQLRKNHHLRGGASCWAPPAVREGQI